MDLLVGCPVLHREWVLPAWWAHVEQACNEHDVEPAYIFVGDPLKDPTFDVVDEIANTREVFVQDTVAGRGRDLREWSWDRYVEMANIRNRMLNLVRELRPTLFLSLDSDILLHEKALVSMVELLDRGFGAVGSRCYMTEQGTNNPSFGTWSREGGIRRSEWEGGAGQVDVIMAIKLMTSTAYAVDYKPDMDGEDIGWSRNCREASVRLGWDGTVCSKHVMNPQMLHAVDDRCGW